MTAVNAVIKAAALLALTLATPAGAQPVYNITLECGHRPSVIVPPPIADEMAAERVAALVAVKDGPAIVAGGTAQPDCT